MSLSKSANPGLPVLSLLQRFKSDSLLRNSFFLMCSTILTSAIGYFYWIVAAHTYTTYNIGLASAFISAMTLTSIFASQGIGSTLVQLLPQRETDRAWSLTLNTCIAMGSMTSLVGGVVVAIALPFLSPQFATSHYSLIFPCIFIVGVVLNTLTSLLDQTFIAERASGNMAARNAIFALLKLMIMLPLIQLGALGIFSSWILALAAAILLAALILLPRLKRRYHFTVHEMGAQIKSMLSAFAGHHFISIGGVLPMYLLPVFVAIRLSVTDNAYFYTTWMMSSVFFMVSPSVATALFSEGSHATREIMQKARNSILIIAMLLAPILLVFLFGGRYILSFFGPGYPQHGSDLLVLLAISAGPDAITNIYVSVLRVQGRLRQAALLNLSMAAITLTLAWFLLPTLGIAGAGWAWLIGQSAGSVAVGIDMFFVRSFASGSVLTENTLKLASSPVTQNYAVAQAIWYIDTSILPAIKLPSVSQALREKDLAFIETTALPTMILPSTKQVEHEKDLSHLETLALPATEAPVLVQSRILPKRPAFKRLVLKKDDE